MMADSAVAAHKAPPFVSELEARHLHPLWDRYQRITPIKPQPRDAPFLWRWRDIEPFLHRAVGEVSINDIERRALIMAHPAFGAETTTTSTLLAAFTVLEPGDRARPHRHTGAAIRFATRADGAATIVNGRRCEMKDGDLILTPPMCWHGHINESDHRIIWFDAANMPLINTLDASFFEPGRRDDAEFFKVDEGNESGYRHSGAVTRRRLGEVSPGAYDTLAVRYVDPLTGGSVMPTLDCYAVRLTPGVSSRRKRTTHNAVCLVVEGEGRSTIGDATFEWSKHDVFTIPHWTWASHQARGGNADLFVVTDRAVYERLELLREELG